MARRSPQRPVELVRRHAYTRQEAAAALGMSVDHFERKVQPHIKVVTSGQLVLVPPPELDRWINDNARYLAGTAA